MDWNEECSKMSSRGAFMLAKARERLAKTARYLESGRSKSHTQDFVRHKVIDYNHQSVDKLYTAIPVKRLLIGTHHFQPTEKVCFTSKGIRIIAPSVKNTEQNIILDIQKSEVVKIVSHLVNPKCVLFIYTLNSCGAYIRESLEMPTNIHDNSLPYFNPSAKTEYFKRIVCIIDTIAEEAKSVIRSIYPATVIEEISARDSQEMIERCLMKDANKRSMRSDTSTIIKEEPTENIRQILIYPQGKGGISINTEDYMCLATDQYLNDVIIDFYLKYLLSEQLNDTERDRTHVFSTFFYKRLTTMTTNRRGNDKDAKLSASQKRHARVKNWTKSVNLFEKDFIIIPINEQSHWFLAIICYPSLKGPETFDGGVPVKQVQRFHKKASDRKQLSLQIGNTTITPVSKREVESIYLGDESERDEAEGDDSDLDTDDSDTEIAEPPKLAPVKQPCILIFDSLAGASRSRVVATLRDYLTCEYEIKMTESGTHKFTKETIPGHSVKVPQQNNFTDCGLYLLQYVEQFFKEPIRDYHIPIKNMITWFDAMVVTRKREEISMLLKDLIKQFNPDLLPLPDIILPTLNGKLLETEESFNEDAEFEEEELDEDFEGEEESEGPCETETESSPEKPAKINVNMKNVTNGGSPRKLFKRTLDDKQISEPAAKKLSRFDELKNN